MIQSSYYIIEKEISTGEWYGISVQGVISFQDHSYCTKYHSLFFARNAIHSIRDQYPEYKFRLVEYSLSGEILEYE